MVTVLLHADVSGSFNQRNTANTHCLQPFKNFLMSSVISFDSLVAKVHPTEVKKCIDQLKLGLVTLELSKILHQ
jgi:hypothetical protein